MACRDDLGRSQQPAHTARRQATVACVQPQRLQRPPKSFQLRLVPQRAPCRIVPTTSVAQARIRIGQFPQRRLHLASCLHRIRPLKHLIALDRNAEPEVTGKLHHLSPEGAPLSYQRRRDVVLAKILGSRCALRARATRSRTSTSPSDGQRRGPRRAAHQRSACADARLMAVRSGSWQGARPRR